MGNFMAGMWRQIQNEELHILYSSLNTIRVIVRKTMGWIGHVART